VVCIVEVVRITQDFDRQSKPNCSRRRAIWKCLRVGHFEWMRQTILCVIKALARSMITPTALSITYCDYSRPGDRITQCVHTAETNTVGTASRKGMRHNLIVRVTIRGTVSEDPIQAARGWTSGCKCDRSIHKWSQWAKREVETNRITTYHCNGL
jgi:hypothetical protein